MGEDMLEQETKPMRPYVNVEQWVDIEHNLDMKKLAGQAIENSLVKELVESKSGITDLLPTETDELDDEKRQEFEKLLKSGTVEHNLIVNKLGLNQRIERKGNFELLYKRILVGDSESSDGREDWQSVLAKAIDEGSKEGVTINQTTARVIVATVKRIQAMSVNPEGYKLQELGELVAMVGAVVRTPFENATKITFNLLGLAHKKHKKEQGIE